MYSWYLWGRKKNPRGNYQIMKWGPASLWLKLCSGALWVLIALALLVVPHQGVVTYAWPVEAFATGIKMESSDQRSFFGADQDEFWATNINRSTHFLRYYWGVATFCPLNSRKIKRSRASERSDQAIKDDFHWSIKILDHGHKRFYRRRVCDYPLHILSKTCSARV